MATTDAVAFLSLIVALSAYIATIRLRLIDEIKLAAGDAARKKKLRRIARGLTLADAPLVASATLLYLHGFWDGTLGLAIAGGPPSWLLTWSILLFTFAGIVLIAHHVAAWRKSVWG